MQRTMGGGAVIILAGCGSGPSAPEELEPPARSTIRGEATGPRIGLPGECEMDLAFEWSGSSRL